MGRYVANVSLDYGDIARRWAFTVRAPLIYPNEASAE